MAAHQHKQQLSAEGAARLVALEAAAAAQAGDMAASSKQLAKLSARVQVRGAAAGGWLGHVADTGVDVCVDCVRSGWGSC